MRTHSFRWTLPVAAVLALAAAKAHALPYYSITDLGSLGGTASDAEDINNLGQVVGYAQTANDAAYHATLWQNGTAQDLGTLAGSANSWAYGINERGQIVGEAGAAGGGRGGKGAPTALPTLWQNGTIQALSAAAGTAQDINEAGQIVGSTVYKLSEVHAAFWQNGSMKDLGPIGQTGTAQAINDTGQMAGGIGTTYYAPVYWPSLGGKTVAGGFSYGVFQDINNAGQIVGVSGKLANTSSAGLPVLVLNGVAKTLPTLGGLGAALGINEAGWVVGWSQTASAAQHATLWQSNGQLSDLNRLLDAGSSGFTLATANAINDFGQIVGQLANGHAYLANPAGTAVWVGGSGGWETGGNWEQGFKPGKLQDPAISPGGGAVTVDGPVADAEIHSLRLGGGAGSAALNVNGGNLAVTADVQVGANGHLGVAAGKTLAAGGYTQTGGSVSADGVLQAPSINIQGGVLDGTGTLQGNVSIGAAASVNPGHSPGSLSVIGDFVLNGTLNIEIAGSGLYDTLNITGNADFSAGTVNFSFINGFVPQAGDSFQWLNVGGTVLGWDLAQINIASLPAGLQYRFGTGNTLQISALPTADPSAAVPAPATGLLFLAALPGLWLSAAANPGWRRRRGNICSGS